MSNRFASSRIAIAECDVCGFRYKLRELRFLVVKGKITNIKACRKCWSPDQPQLRLGEFPVADPQAIQDPRPDFAGYAQSRAVLAPATPAISTGFIGTVTVTVS